MPTVADRNNNPGNIRDISTGSFRKFNTPQEGYAALLNDLKAKQTGTTSTGVGPHSTLADFAKVYAPPGDNNNSAQYTANLANHMGVRPDAKLSELNLGSWADAVAHAEGYSKASPPSKSFNPTPFSSGSINLPETPTNTIASAKPGSFIGDLGQDFTKAKEGVDTARARYYAGQQGLTSSLFQSLGAGAGGVGSAINTALEHTPLIGGLLKRGEEFVGKGVGAVANTELGQKAVGAYGNFAQAHPEAAGNIGAAANIASVVPVFKGLGLAKNAVKTAVKEAVPTALKVSAKVPGLVGRSATQVIDNRAFSEAEKVLKETPKLKDVKAVQKGGNLPSEGLVPDARKAESIKEVANLVKNGTVKVSNHVNENSNAIARAATSETKRMRDLLEAPREVQHIVDPREVAGMANKTLERAGDVVINGEKPAQKLLEKFFEGLPTKGVIKPADLLDARQAVSRYILRNKGNWSFDQHGAFINARNAIWDESRDLLAKSAPDVPVMDSLAKQTALYRALDYIAPAIKKAATLAEKPTSFGQRHPFVKGLIKHGAQGVGAAVGLGGLAKFID